ncbi:MAG TPA: amidohydrolase family protein [Rhizomicrobium sp.]|jgi:predicted TIM-barrel fold metal-dependent hydrolase
MRYLNRRGVIGAGLALATSPAMTPALAKDARVSFALPDGATDCHHHIYDPQFPYNPNAVLKPPFATVSDYRVLQKKLGTSRNVMVQPSTYGTDNACVLDVLAQLGESCRAVCVVNSKVSDDELKRLNAAGVRGVRVQFGLGNPVGADEVMPLAKRIAAMGWHIQCNMPADQLVQMTPLLLSLPVPVIIDHLGRAVDDKGPQFVAVRKLLDSGHGWVKLSGAYLYGGGTSPDYAGASLAAMGYLRAAPERCVWGSDWPHPDATKKLNPVAMPDDVVLLNLLAQWAPDAKLRHRILVENPEKFYGFDPARRPKAN